MFYTQNFVRLNAISVFFLTLARILRYNTHLFLI